MMREIAIFGLGKLGKSLAITYSNMGGKVIAVDMLQERVDEVADYVTYALRADVTEENVIKNLGVSGVDMAIITIGENFEASIIVTAVCKEIGIPYIIAKATDTLQASILKKWEPMKLLIRKYRPDSGWQKMWHMAVTLWILQKYPMISALWKAKCLLPGLEKL